jgi:NAD(P)H-flavin reductase/nitrite reductase/ring-hydroxylating ferredoxin subunit
MAGAENGGDTPIHSHATHAVASQSHSAQEECVAKLSALKPNSPLPVQLCNGDEAFVVRVVSQGEDGDDEIFCLGNVCPHSEAKLHKGDIEDLGALVEVGRDAKDSLCVKCPKHRKKFCGNGLFFGLQDGQARVVGPTSKFDPSWNVPTYDVRVDEKKNKVFVSVPEHKHVSSCTKRAWEKWTLGKRTQHSHDSWVFHFQRQDEGASGKASSAVSSDDSAVVGRQCWHVTLKLNFRHLARKKSVKREYTPVSNEQDFRNGSMDILIKIYPRGKLTSRLHEMAEGDQILVSGPEETLPLPSLRPSIGWKPACTAEPQEGGETGENQMIGCVVGGTGIAPVIQLLRVASASPDVFTGGPPQFRVICSNHTEDDILLRESLTELKDELDLEILHTLTGSMSKKWKGSKGRINREMLEGFLPPPSSRTTIVTCGPSGMNAAAQGILRGVGYDDHCVVELEA